MQKSSAKLKLVDNMIVSLDTSNLWGSLLIYESRILRAEAGIDCLRAISEGMISVECSHEF